MFAANLGKSPGIFSSILMTILIFQGGHFQLDFFHCKRFFKVHTQLFMNVLKFPNPAFNMIPKKVII